MTEPTYQPQTISLPQPPDGCTPPTWEPLWLSVDPTAFVLIGETWWRAKDVVTPGGAWWLVVREKVEAGKGTDHDRAT